MEISILPAVIAIGANWRGLQIDACLLIYSPNHLPSKSKVEIALMVIAHWLLGTRADEVIMVKVCIKWQIVTFMASNKELVSIFS